MSRCYSPCLVTVQSSTLHFAIRRKEDVQSRAELMAAHPIFEFIQSSAVTVDVWSFALAHVCMQSALSAVFSFAVSGGSKICCLYWRHIITCKLLDDEDASPTAGTVGGWLQRAARRSEQSTRAGRIECANSRFSPAGEPSLKDEKQGVECHVISVPRQMSAIVSFFSSRLYFFVERSFEPPAPGRTSRRLERGGRLFILA